MEEKVKLTINNVVFNGTVEDEYASGSFHSEGGSISIEADPTTIAAITQYIKMEVLNK